MPTVLKTYLLLNVSNFIKPLLNVSNFIITLFSIFMYYFQNNYGSYIYDN